MGYSGRRRHLTEEELGHKKQLRRIIQNGCRWKKCIGDSYQGNYGLGKGIGNRLFHRMANAHRRANNLVKLRLMGEVTEDQEVRDGIVNAYQQLLSESSDWKADIGGLVLKQISLSEAEALEFPFLRLRSMLH
ncbi:hypothetical protein CK203_019451 [Vitis vinifera]|uniref:Uncharacterized protein n=1 Tax=Vitis vinifera TaxID=29760 RepID=A0A438IZ78_VITVI|nr:hypothetical protein CK203_019451 [Vitis vinifera]